MARSFYKKKLFNKVYISYYPESNSHISDAFKIVLDLSNYSTKNKLEHTTDVDISHLAA